MTKELEEVIVKFENVMSIYGDGGDDVEIEITVEGVEYSVSFSYFDDAVYSKVHTYSDVKKLITAPIEIQKAVISHIADELSISIKDAQGWINRANRAIKKDSNDNNSRTANTPKKSAAR